MQKNVAFSCFVDAKPKFEKEAVRWLWSLVHKLKVDPQDIYITCDSGISDEFRAKLDATSGLNIFFEDCFTEESRPANKWLQLKALCAAKESYTHVVVSDCDKVFLEFSHEWCDDSIRACKFIPRPTFAIFEDIFDVYFQTSPRFIMDRPDQQDEFKDGRSYVNNHNGGLIIIPTHRIDTITARWKHYIDQLMIRPELLRKNFRNLDQVAFAMVMHEIGSDINFLPPTFDFGPNISVASPHVLASGSGQLVLHVHGYDDEDGRIQCGPQVPVEFAEMVDAVNDEYVEWNSSYA